jgi:two-component system, NtrC family, response regulator AtoC
MFDLLAGITRANFTSAQRHAATERSPPVRSSATKELRSLVARVAASPASTVLLTGESGTGKDLVAKIIHYTSERASKPFMNITCSALPEQLLESELFGHERGAFTDARLQKTGLLERADGGTVFLDEIGEMTPGLQAKLLRFLEEKSFRRVGGSHDIRVDVRVVAATNRNLEEEVASTGSARTSSSV